MLVDWGVEEAALGADEGVFGGAYLFLTGGRRLLTHIRLPLHFCLARAAVTRRQDFTKHAGLQGEL